MRLFRIRFDTSPSSEDNPVNGMEGNKYIVGKHVLTIRRWQLGGVKTIFLLVMSGISSTDRPTDQLFTLLPNSDKISFLANQES